MALTGLPADAPQVGSIEIVLYLGEDGVGTAYGLEGISPEAAIGYMTIVSDRIREERSFQWDTCSACGRPWSDHEDHDDDEEPQLYDQEDDE